MERRREAFPPGAGVFARACVSGGGRWARTISRAGEIMDATSDLYDLAFVIFALAWRFRVSGDSEALMLARETLAYIQKEHANAHGGYCEQRPQIGPRLQNPHMHLLESCLAAYEAFGASEFLAEAINIVDLMKRKLYDGASVGEEFDANWTRCSNTVEPGHQFEWVWILTQFQRLSGENLSGLAEALYVFAEAHGVSAHGLVYDQIDRAGGVTRATSRIWTNTERLKAALGRFELTGADAGAALHQSFDLIARKYFGARPAGLFVDRLDAEGTPIVGPTPASCLYHIVLAFTEMLRLEPAIVASHQASPRLPTTAARDVQPAAGV